MRRLATWALALLSLVATAASAADPIPGIGPAGEVKKLHGGLMFTEGPASDGKGNLYFSDVAGNKLYKSDSSGDLSAILDPSNNTNGLMVNAAGNVVACEMAGRLIEVNPRLMGSCLPNLFRLAGGGDIFELLVRIHLGERIEPAPSTFTRYATVRWFGAADAQPKPEHVPDLDWAAAAYGDALHSLTVRFPDGDTLLPCRGNLGNFGEVQVVHPDRAASIRIAEDIVAGMADRLGFEVTR